MRICFGRLLITVLNTASGTPHKYGIGADSVSFIFMGTTTATNETYVNCIKGIPIKLNTHELVYRCVATLMETIMNYLLAHMMKAYLSFWM